MYPELRTEDSILVFPRPPEFITATEDPDLIGTDKGPGFIIENPGVVTDPLRRRGRDMTKRNHRQNSTNFDNTTGVSNSKQTQRPPRRSLAELLVISPNDFISARELYESQTSFGQSFVSLSDNLFYDMTDKSLYYTCSNKATSCCLDTDKAIFRACRKNSIRPAVTQISGTLVYFSMLRYRGRGEEFDSSLMKVDKVYDDVQWW